MTTADSVLDYLERLPGYPFDADIDPDFVQELETDFPAIDILEQIKAFRWHHDGKPAERFKSIRPAIRRWLKAAHRFDHPPF